MLQLLLGLVGTIVVIAAAVAAYYVFSYAILYVVGRAFPLAGRHRRQ
jgi:hypothetical protein